MTSPHSAELEEEARELSQRFFAQGPAPIEVIAPLRIAGLQTAQALQPFRREATRLGEVARVRPANVVIYHGSRSGSPQ